MGPSNTNELALAVLAARGRGREKSDHPAKQGAARKDAAEARRVGLGSANDTTKHRRPFVLLRAEANTERVSRAIARVHRLHLFS
jgi:hypothetical protein